MSKYARIFLALCVLFQLADLDVCGIKASSLVHVLEQPTYIRIEMKVWGVRKGEDEGKRSCRFKGKEMVQFVMHEKNLRYQPRPKL